MEAILKETVECVYRTIHNDDWWNRIKNAIDDKKDNKKENNLYSLKIIDKRYEDGTPCYTIKLTQGQVLPTIKGFENLRKSLEKDYKREDYKFYYRRIDCPTPTSSRKIIDFITGE